MPTELTPKDLENEKAAPEKEPLPVHNPFEPGDDRPVTQEDVDNEQKAKEAMSERD